MRTGRSPSTFAVIAFLAVILAPGLLQTALEIRDGERPRALEVLDRPPTAANLRDYERDLERSSVVIGRLRPWVQSARWHLLGDAGGAAVAGRDGWLFYRPSVRHMIEREGDAIGIDPENPLPAIRSFRDQLRARRIRLLVVPVPGKESVYPGMLSGRAEGAGVVVCESTRRLLDELARSGIEHMDLFEAFRRARQGGEGRSDSSRLYLRQDSHWSPEGARVAAIAVARRVLDAGLVRRGDHPYAELPVAVRRRGDLVRMLQSPPIERAIEPEVMECRQVIEPGDGAPYRDANDSDVLVLGDSFSTIYQQDEPGSAGFLAHLARGLGRPLAAIVNDGGGPTTVRQALARRPALLNGKALVIWEFAEREIRRGSEGWRIVPLRGAAPGG